MTTFATLALTLFAIAVLINLANGTLGAWLKAKFLGIAPKTAPSSNVAVV